jgi:hypothetical protein
VKCGVCPWELVAGLSMPTGGFHTLRLEKKCQRGGHSYQLDFFEGCDGSLRRRAPTKVWVIPSSLITAMMLDFPREISM